MRTDGRREEKLRAPGALAPGARFLCQLQQFRHLLINVLAVEA